MANLPENTTYGGSPGTTPAPIGAKYSAPRTGSIPTSAPGFKYTPSSTYRNLANLKASGASPFAPSSNALPGTQEYEDQKQAGILQYGKLLNEGLGIPTQMQFLPPLGDINQTISIPKDYGTFAEPMTIDSDGQKLSWGTPSNPVIKNIAGDVPGQYVEDVSDPNLLVKTVRGSNSLADQAIRNNRPGFMYQIDHIMPLALGGADTLANRQLLTAEQNDAKTRAQAIPYTLYAYGQISLNEARAMAMKWKDRDVTDIPQPNSVGLIPGMNGKSGLEIAKDVAYRWTQPKKETLKEKIGKIPEAMKNLGEGYLPDPVREFIKGAAAGFTLGFLPYEQDDNEGVGSKVAGIAGMAAGGLASFILGGMLIDGALALGGAARGSIAAYRGLAAAKAAQAGFAGAETAIEAAQVAKGVKTAATTFKTLNKAPGYLKNILTAENVARAGKLGATSVLVGQGSQFVENKFNPYTLSGKGLETDEGIGGTIGNMFRDLSLGVATGVMPPTLKGTAYATMLPLTISFISDPDDPTTALTNGVIFGAMHAIGTARKPGYNDVKMFGGKPFENPVIKSFEETANKAAYVSLSHYAPEILPELKAGEVVPAASKLPDIVQQAKDTAIKNIWTRFLVGKNMSEGTKAKTLSEFQNFSQNVETVLGKKQPKLSGLDKFSLGKRKEATTELRSQNAAIKEEFGKGYQARNKTSDITSAIPEEGMDLQTALTEIKRITASARQLYKGGLTTEARNLADIDDLLSFGKTQLQGRFDSMERFSNPPVAKQAIDSIDDSFMKYSFNNSRSESTGQFPSGDAAVTGAALNINKTAAKYFFDQKAAGNASPNILLIDRSDTAPLWRMKNKLLDPKDITEKSYAVDVNPDNALQAFGVVKNPQTGAKELVPLGWMASNFRLNEAIGKNHRAFNQHPAVLKYKETGGAEGLRPLNLHKDQIAPTMKKEGISVLVANLDPRATVSTIETGNPFIPINVNDANWIYSKKLGNRLSQQGNRDPISMSIAKVKNAVNAKQKTEAIAEMNNKIVRPASDYIPKTGQRSIQEIIPISKNDNVTMPKEITRSLIKDVESSLDVADHIQLKEAFKKNFGIILEEGQAMDLFNRRNDMTFRDGVRLLVDAVNKGNIDESTKVKLNFAKIYLESGALQSSDVGKVVPDMKLIGRVKMMQNNQTADTRPPVRVAKKPIAKQQLQIEIPSNKQTADTRPVVQEDIATFPQQSSTAIIEKPAVSLADRITTSAKKEYLTIPKKTSVAKTIQKPITSEEMNIATNIAKSYIPEGIALLEDAKFSGRGYGLPEHGSIISGIEKRINNDLQSKNVSQAVIDEVKSQVRTALEGQSELQVPLKDSEMLSEKDIKMGKKNPLYGAPEEIDRPKFIAREFYDNIKENLNNDNPGAKYWAKSLDTVLESVIGKNYQNNPRLPKVLAKYFNDVFFNDVNAAGKEITQHKDIVNARGAGDKKAEFAAYEARKKQLSENKTGDGGTLTGKEMSERGLEAGDEGFKELNVRPWYQDDSMIHDLTQGEDMISALFSETPQGAATAVRAIKNLTLGTSGNIGLREYLLKNIPEAKKGSIPFAKLEQEAVSVDSKIIADKKLAEERALKDKQELEDYEATAKNLSGLLEEVRTNPDEMPVGLTMEMMESRFKEVMDTIKKLSKNKEGQGGPGYDGRGGIGSFFGGIWDKIKNGNTFEFKPEAPKPTYDLRGIKASDSDFDEASKIFLGEISNRKPEKQAFEVQVALNTAINRALSNPKKYEGSLLKVLQEPGQYQAYAPSGTYKGGKVIENDYQRAMKGDLDYPTQQKLKLIQDTLSKLKTDLKDNTGGKMFYVHASDGSMWLGTTIDEAKKIANDHEKRNRLPVTRWGTASGLPAELVQR